jgi:hypothetical protein
MKGPRWHEEKDLYMNLEADEFQVGVARARVGRVGR